MTVSSVKTGYDGVSFLAGNNVFFPAVRAMFGGGGISGSAAINVIQYFDPGTLGNTVDFGDLTVARNDLGGCASSTRGLFIGGYTMPSYTNSNIIDYVTIASAGNATDFGDLSNARSGTNSSFSSSTRGMVAGGYEVGYVNTIEYVTIANTGNATDFGDLTVARGYAAGASSNTRGVVMAGYAGGADNTIDYVTIATTGNAIDFGDIIGVRYYIRGGGSSTRAVFAGGQGSGATFTKTIQYITIASAGNATSFGDYDIATDIYNISACSSYTRVVFAGGANPNTGANYSTMRYITTATLGNAISFGDLLAANSSPSGLSNGHGGL